MQCYVSLHALTKSSFAMSVNISAQNEIRPKILDARLVSEVGSHAVIQSRHIQTERVFPPTRGKLEKKADYVSMKRPSERKTTSGIIPVCDLDAQASNVQSDHALSSIRGRIRVCKGEGGGGDILLFMIQSIKPHVSIDLSRQVLDRTVGILKIIHAQIRDQGDQDMHTSTI